MPGHRMERITEDIHRELTAIFREVKDPRVRDSMLSIVRVNVTNDLSYCTVIVSSMMGLEQCKKGCTGLKSAAGFIRGELGRRLKLRHVPELHFTASDSIEYGANISRMINELNIGENDDEEDKSE